MNKKFLSILMCLLAAMVCPVFAEEQRGIQGMTEPYNDAVLSVKSAGPLAVVRVTEGGFVKKGGIICGHDCELQYSKSSPEIREVIDNNLGSDFTGLYHAGVVRGLFDYFNDDYLIMPNTTIWFKEIGVNDGSWSN